MAQYVVLLDRQHAKIFSMAADGSALALHWTPPNAHTHHGDASNKVSDHFYHEVAAAMAGASAILVVGSGVAKQQFKHHLERHDPRLSEKVVAYESADHPTDGELLDHARRFFRNPLNIPRPQAD